MFAQSGVMRSGASRSGYYTRADIRATLGGVNIRNRMIMPGTEIQECLDDVPSLIRFDIKGDSTFEPVKGQEIIVGLGVLSNRIFAGYLLNVVLTKARKQDAYPIYHCEGIDYTWQLNWKLVEGLSWENTSASYVIRDIVAAFAPAFSLGRVEAAMPSIDFRANHDETVAAAITRIMRMVGGHWHVDYDRTIHAYRTPETDGNPVTVNSTTDAWAIERSSDISQVRTRTRVMGGSADVTVATAAGATSIPVNETRLFGSSGGYALVGGNRISYTGKSVAAGAGNLTGIPASGDFALKYSVPVSEPITVLAVAEDAAAAAALAAIIGTGDGYVEHVITDGQLGDVAARAAAAGDVASNKDPETRLSYKTRQRFTKLGKNVTFSLINAATGATIISGDYQVQELTLSNLQDQPGLYPVKTIRVGKDRTEIARLLSPLA